ncbi:MAG: hypothetical protein OYH76_02105 [Defluviicoccus sp.]|nr:hypothetical protein [Defluviicoccus sp.]
MRRVHAESPEPISEVGSCPEYSDSRLDSGNRNGGQAVPDQMRDALLALVCIVSLIVNLNTKAEIDKLLSYLDAIEAMADEGQHSAFVEGRDEALSYIREAIYKLAR